MSFPLFLFLLVIGSPRFFITGGYIKDKDVWSSSWEKEEDNSRRRRILEVRFDEPAKHWTYALPIGNGRLGSMIWGGIAHDPINLNEDTLWTGIPGNYTDPDAPVTLSKVRKLVDNRQYEEATTAAVGLSGNPSDVSCGSLVVIEKYYLFRQKLEKFSNRSTLPMKSIMQGNILSLNPDEVIVIRISGNKSSSLNFTVSMDSKLHHHSYVNNKSQIILDGSCPGRRIPPLVYGNDDPKGRGPLGPLQNSILQFLIYILFDYISSLSVNGKKTAKVPPFSFSWFYS
ncbi:hypothetical protein ACS0TY_035332 [Phlomoides rotata]